jgi:hypothetical protein
MGEICNQTIVYFHIAPQCCARHDYLRLFHVTALHSISRRCRRRLHRGMLADPYAKERIQNKGQMDFLPGT